MKNIDQEYTTLQTLSTAVEYGLGLAQEVMCKRGTDQFISKHGRSQLAEQMLSDLQTQFINELGAAQYANR